MKKLSLILLLFPFMMFGAQPENKKFCDTLTIELNKIGQHYITAPNIKIEKCNIDHNQRQVSLVLSDAAGNLPIREEIVDTLRQTIKNLLPIANQKYKININTRGVSIEYLIPNYYKSDNIDDERVVKTNANKVVTWVNNLSRPYRISRGLSNRYIALWQSHGRYFNQSSERWEWQRCRLFETVEDLYTQSYVLPFLVPMLENAGAYVVMPRERALQTEEYIIDNDTSLYTKGYYKERNGDKKWSSARNGFAHIQSFYIDGQNPFNMGSFRTITTQTSGTFSKAIWFPQIEKRGKYALYISYHSLPKSTTDAQYAVYHKGGVSHFKVNQQIGGGTWVYLGDFEFDSFSPIESRIEVSNKSDVNGAVLTADAIKIGGGMGNIARNAPNKNAQSTVTPQVSGYPRFTEGARYFLQWAGMPDTLYSNTKEENDYIDDIRSRSLWVNYLAGGSSVLPHRKGLSIPIDMALGFHTDAGILGGDSIVGTLSIYHAQPNKGVYENGLSRMASRDLCDMVQSQIVSDIRQLYTANWSRRGMWDKNYYEASMPQVPTMLLELLSHQNFNDMRYGLDPAFRFNVSRSIYKGILKYITSQNNSEYVVQPLPINSFNITLDTTTHVARLKWEPTTDSLEHTATPREYLLYTRINDGAFDMGRTIDYTNCDIVLDAGKIYSFKVSAVNSGGESFPSEILSVCSVPRAKGTVMIINGFDRIAAPYSYNTETMAGFNGAQESGVAYLQDISHVGSMYEFRKEKSFMINDAPGFGASYGDFENKLIAGNSFDYPYLHGKAFALCHYSFVSSSRLAIEKGMINLSKYAIVDIILGKQLATQIGSSKSEPLFKTFSNSLQKEIKKYCTTGKSLFVSGAHVGTDLWEGISATKADIQFAQNVLRFKFLTNNAARTGRVKAQPPFKISTSEMTFQQQLNDRIYAVETPDGIEPVTNKGRILLRYAENNIGAAVMDLSAGYKTIIMGFPFESINSETQRNELMQSFIDIFEKK